MSSDPNQARHKTVYFLLPPSMALNSHFITTKDDHAGVALTVCTLLATWTVLCFVIRIHQRSSLRTTIGPDDIVCGVATVGNGKTRSALVSLLLIYCDDQVFAVIQTIVSGLAIAYGFGKSTELGPTRLQIINAEKVRQTTISLSVWE